MSPTDVPPAADEAPDERQETAPADSLVLQLWADEPEGDRLDVTAFIRVWPQLIERWEDDDQTTAAASGTSDFARVKAWLEKMRQVRTEVSLMTERDHPRHTDTDPGA
jgi:hypothetical protein